MSPTAGQPAGRPKVPFCRQHFDLNFFYGQILYVDQNAFKIIPNSPIAKNWVLVQMMAWCQTGDRSMSEPMKPCFWWMYLPYHASVACHYFNQCWPRCHMAFLGIIETDGWGISCENVLTVMSLDLTDGTSTLVLVMALCHQATSHYLNQYDLDLLPYSRHHRVKDMDGTTAVLKCGFHLSMSQVSCRFTDYE